MNRTDRLLAIVLELQRYRRSHRRAEDLAATFEVSKRTIYRDVQALCAAGVPIVALDRQGYTLAEGYFLPPLSFTTDEALMLALGSGFLSTVFDNDYQNAARAAYSQQVPCRRLSACRPGSSSSTTQPREARSTPRRETRSESSSRSRGTFLPSRPAPRG